MTNTKKKNHFHNVQSAHAATNEHVDATVEKSIFGRRSTKLNFGPSELSQRCNQGCGSQAGRQRKGGGGRLTEKKLLTDRLTEKSCNF